jgi:hypothetical protein
MARTGRKRKGGPRHPGGQLVREKKPDDRIRTARQPHRRGVRSEDRMDERAESPLGRLALRNVITSAMHDAGSRFNVVVGAYRATIEAPKGTSGGGGARSSCWAEEADTANYCRIASDDCFCLRTKNTYDAAFEALSARGQIVAKVVARVAVHREDILPQDLVYLKVGLEALARHFGLTGAR